MNINSITLVGRVAAHPTIRYFESGAVCTTCELLVHRRTLETEVAEAPPAPDCFALELWGKQAELAANEIRQDSLIGIIGSVQRRSLDHEQPGAAYIRVDRLEMLGQPREKMASGVAER